MKNILTLVIAMVALVNLSAQEYTINKSSGKLKIIEVGKITFKGGSGSDIVISTEDGKSAVPERAKGLSVISPGGLKDNTGIGLSVKSEGDETIVEKVSNKSGKRYIVTVPNGVSLFYEHSNHDGGRLEIADISNEIEVSANYNDVKITNATGPLAINSVYGSIEAEFDQVNQDHSISLYSVYDHVDVTVPSSTKANFTLTTSYGEMFTDLELDFGTSDEMRKISSNKVEGKFNGGGVDFFIKSSYDDVYLRKK